MTLDTYTHVDLEQMRAGLAKLGDLFAGVDSG
jgi:hypothetical protein